MDAVSYVKHLITERFDKTYDCMLFTVGHSSIGASKALYNVVPEKKGEPTPTIITGLAAPPGTLCFTSNERVMANIKIYFERTLRDISNGNGSLYGLSPKDVLERFIAGIKAQTPKEEADRVKMDAFRQTRPVLSTNNLWYYNRRWSFYTNTKEGKRAGGFVLLVSLTVKGVQLIPLYESKIREGVVNDLGEWSPFRLTKETLLNDLFDRTPLRHPFLIDLGCSSFMEDERVERPISLDEFMEKGVYGGKKKRRKKTKRLLF